MAILARFSQSARLLRRHGTLHGRVTTRLDLRLRASALRAVSWPTLGPGHLERRAGEG